MGGAGREAFDPRMMIALLAYAYCGGVRSSRAIERACRTDVAFRVVCAQRVPDHSVVSRFRADHAEALAGLFAQVLVVCARAGLGRVGLVAIDGTKIAANASLGRNRTQEWFVRQAEEMLAEAAATDAAEDAAAAGGDEPGDRLGPGWRDRSGRKARIKAALEEIRVHNAEQDQPVEQAEQQAEQARQDYEQAKAERAARIASPERRLGRPLNPDCEPRDVTRARQRAERAAARAEKLRAVREQAPARQANSTDPTSRIMRTRRGWIQGYNNQTAVSSDGIILAVRTSNEAVDTEQFVPVMEAAVQAAALIGAAAGQPDREIGIVLADAGYFSHDNLQAEGPDRLIAAGKKHNITGDAADGQPRPDDPRRPTCHVMVERLRQPEAAALYRQRAAIVEPVNGHLKDRRGLRRFSRRGLDAAAAEFTFAAWVTNLMKLHTTQSALA